jgi:hypothetical protein
MSRQAFRSVDLSSHQVELNSSNGNARGIHTFFRDGFIVELPTRWIRSISFEPRYSPLTINQYAHNTKDLLLWLCESERYPGLSLDEMLTVIRRRDLQEWILDGIERSR